MQDIRRTPSIADVAQDTSPRVGSPQEAIKLLMEGNARFFNGEAQGKTLNAYERRLQIVRQTPYAVILGCSDSRVPVEIIFDQGPGDLFVVRVAGNVVESGVLGTIEFAIKYLHIATIMVLGHEGCGAVQLALKPPAERVTDSQALGGLLEAIVPAVEDVPAMRDPKARMREAVVRNVKHQMHKLSQVATVSSAIQSGRIGLVGGFYEIGSGAVDFLDPE